MPNKKLSRRDAFKILGATLGATVLANLPSKWSKPEVISGVLPAHAQATCGPLTFLGSGSIVNVGQNGTYAPSVTISSPTANISLNLSASSISGGAISPVVGPIGTYLTNAGGTATAAPAIPYSFGILDGTITFTWSFVNASDGCDIQDIQLSYT